MEGMGAVGGEDGMWSGGWKGMGKWGVEVVGVGDGGVRGDGGGEV